MTVKPYTELVKAYTYYQYGKDKDGQPLLEFYDSSADPQFVRYHIGDLMRALVVALVKKGVLTKKDLFAEL